MSVISEVLLGIVTILILYALWIEYSKQRVRVLVNKFPGPKALPIVGNALDYYFNRNVIAKFIYGKDDNGRVRLWVGRKPVIYLSNAIDIQMILSSPTQTTKSAEYDFYVPWLDYGIFTSSGIEWKKIRKLLVKVLNIRVFDGFLRVFNDQSHILVHQLNSQVAEVDTFNVVPFTSLCSFDVLCETVFGVKSNTQLSRESIYLRYIDRIKTAIHTRQFKMLLWPDLLFNMSTIGREHNKCVKLAHEFTENIVKTKRIERENNQNFENPEKHNNLIDLLLDVKENGKSFSDATIRSEADALIFGGQDTISSALGWALFLVGSHPHVQEKIHQEVDKIFGEEKFKDLTMEDLKEMTYLECVIKESLRRVPSVPIIGRKLETDVVLNDGQIIPAGVSVYINIFKLHKNPEVFTNPEVFDPDRFLPENIKKEQPYFIPFSNGPRNCLGQIFAMMEEKVVLSHIFRSFCIKSIHTFKEVKQKADLVILAKNGIKLQFTPRV